MLFCSHAVETTVETGPDLATSSDLKVSGFAGRIHRMRVDERHIWKEKFADSKVSGYVWTGPKLA